MKVSLIISVYKNVAFLAAVLDSVSVQTVMPNEVIVSEDGESPEMRNLLASRTGHAFDLVHLTQPDEGWRKNRALNQAIRSASHPYLIFIDGDCVLHTRFVENHLKLAHSQDILAGKRVKLGPSFSTDLLQGTPLPIFQRGLMGKWQQLRKDGAKFMEELIYIPPNALSRWLIRLLGISAIKGCNFSCHKDAMLAINGFDEDYILPAIGEDIDLVWRFKGLGYEIVSVRHFAVQYHLHHAESWTSQEENVRLMRQKQAMRLYQCRNGVYKQSVTASD